MNLLIKYEMGLFIASYKVNEMCKIYIFKLFLIIKLFSFSIRLQLNLIN